MPITFYYLAEIKASWNKEAVWGGLPVAGCCSLKIPFFLAPRGWICLGRDVTLVFAMSFRRNCSIVQPSTTWRIEQHALPVL